MSKHFKISLGIIALVSIALFVGYRYVLQRIRDGVVRTRPVAAVLPKNDKETVSFNEKTHVLTVVTATKTLKEYAKSPEVEIRKDGTVVVSRHLTGFENEWFMGAGLTLSGPRFFVGNNVFHLSRFDVQAGVGVPFEKQTGFLRLYTGLGYNFYSNTSINVSVNPLAAAQRIPDVAVFLSTRF